MKAWQLVRFGGPEQAFRHVELADPRPAAGQVLIQSEGFGINYADVMARKGLYRDAPPPPCVLGYETVGRIVAVGEGVPAQRIGQRVTAITRFGGYARLVATDQRACAVIPDDMGLGEACALATQGCTAWYIARIAAPLRKGERVLIHSAAGGVGHLLVQLAVADGGEVFAVASGKEKMDLLRALGAHHIIDRAAGDAPRHIAQELHGAKLDASFNAVGGSTFRQDLRSLGAHGRLVIYGGAERKGGLFGALGFVWRMGLVVPVLWMMKSRSLIGVNMLRIGEQRPDLLTECLEGMVRAARSGEVRPHVGAVLPAEQLAQAHALVEGGRSLGKVVLRW